MAPTTKASRIAYFRCVASHCGVTTPARASATSTIGSWKARPNARYMLEQKLNTACVVQLVCTKSASSDTKYSNMTGNAKKYPNAQPTPNRVEVETTNG